MTQRRVSDVLVVVLAVVSVVLIGLSAFADLTRTQQLTIFWIDVGICVLFALEFLTSWSHLQWRPAFLLRNWYDVLGMIPVAHPVFVSGGWTRLLWGVVVLARIGRAADRLFGEKVTASVTKRATGALVDAVKHPITVAVLEEVAAVLQTGHYTKNTAAALAENREEIKNMVREKIEEDRLTGRITVVPYSDKLVDTVSETTMRVIFAVLDDPRTDELVADLLRENILQMRAEVHDRAYGDGRGVAAWSPVDREAAGSRSGAGVSSGTTAAISAQSSGVGSPDVGGHAGDWRSDGSTESDGAGADGASPDGASADREGADRDGADGNGADSDGVDRDGADAEATSRDGADAEATSRDGADPAAARRDGAGRAANSRAADGRTAGQPTADRNGDRSDSGWTGVRDSTRPTTSPDPLAPWRRPRP